MRKSDSALDFDYVYMSSETSTFENLKVKLNVGSQKMLLQVLSDHEIPEADLAPLFDGIKDYALKRLKITYGEDTDAQLIVNGETFHVTHDDGIYRLTK